MRKNIRDDLNRIFGEELGSLNIKFETNEFGLDDYAKLISSKYNLIRMAMNLNCHLRDWC